MSREQALRTAIYTALNSGTYTVHAEEVMPMDKEYPFITIGTESITNRRERTKTHNRTGHAIVVHTYSKSHSLQELFDMNEHVKEVLFYSDVPCEEYDIETVFLDVHTNQNQATSDGQLITDIDGTLRHGIIQLRFMVSDK